MHKYYNPKYLSILFFPLLLCFCEQSPNTTAKEIIDFENIIKDSLELEASNWHVKGVDSYSNGNAQIAIEHFKKARTIRHKIYPNGHYDLINTHFNIGVVLSEGLGRLEEANTAFTEAISICNQMSLTSADSSLCAQAHMKLGNLLAKKGEIKTSEALFDTSKKLGKTSISFLEQIFDLYEEKGAYEEMKSVTFQAIQLSKHRLVKTKKSNDTEDLVNAYNNLGMAYDYAGMIDSAIYSYKESLKLNIDTSAETSTNLSILYREKGNPKKALFWANVAVHKDRLYYDSTELSASYLAQSLNTQSLALAKLNRFPEAIESINTAISFLGTVYTTNFKKDYLTLLIDKISIQQQELKANQYIDKQISLENSLHIFNQIVTLIDLIRQDYELDDSKEILSQKSKSIFDNAINIYWELYQLTPKQSYVHKALEMAERSKSIILLEAILTSQAEIQDSSLNQLIAKETELKSQKIELELNLKEFDDNENFEKEYADVLVDLKNHRNIIRQNYPHFYSQIYEQVDLSDLINKPIKGNFIEYFIGEEAIYIFARGYKSEIYSFAKIEKQDIETLVATYRKSIYESVSVNNSSSKERKYYQEVFLNTSKKLYDLLITPIDSIVLKEKKLTIVPDDILGFLPFETLMDSLPQDVKVGEWQNYEYLFDRFKEINYNYSLALIHEMDQRIVVPEKNCILAFAPTFEGRKEPWVTPLEHNEKEAKFIKADKCGKVCIGKQATKQNFRETAPIYSVIHLATHGKADTLKNGNSYLAFTENSNKNSGLLHVNELYSIKLNAELVVLSACETAIGQITKGEGIMSISRGFSYAGAKSILTTLWPVKDKVTQTIMNEFYKNIKNEQDKGYALIKAKVVLKDSIFYHPYYWGGYTIIGNTNPIRIDDNSFWGKF